MKFKHLCGISFLVCWLILGASPEARGGPPPLADIGDRLELFVDDYQIQSLERVRLKLHPPRRAETVLRFDKPWEGPHAAYITVFQDGDKFRMYYRGWAELEEEALACYAESTDGIHWTRPDLGLYEWEGSKENNIIWKGLGTHNFTPFKDSRPGVAANEKYKALGRGLGDMRKTLHAFASPDGIHWKLLAEKPVIIDGAFDSQNLAFWDPTKHKYVSYFRIFRNGYRAIALAESEDFLHWSDTTPVDTGNPLTGEHFYTNATVPYFRAPRFYFAFPKRFFPDRQRLPEHPSKGISEAVFMSSRDGLHFDRTFLEALIRPGRDRRNWGDRSTMVAWGILPTGRDEMSIYFSQHYRYESHHLRRGVFRLDGIASAHAGATSGQLITKPLRFDGSRLIVNYSTAAGGSIRVEIQDAAGRPIPGFRLSESTELYGDKIAEAYSWNSGSDVSALAGEPVRLRFVMEDCDLYSYRFRE